MRINNDFLLKPRDMTDDRIDVCPTSSNSADASPIVLSEKDNVSLRFIPLLVNNPKDSLQGVKGKFVYTRRGNCDTSVVCTDDVIKIDKNRVRQGGSIELNLNSEEVYKLYKGLQCLFQLKSGMDDLPKVDQTFFTANTKLEKILELIKDNDMLQQFIDSEDGYSLFKNIVDKQCSVTVKRVLTEIQDSKLDLISLYAGNEKLQRLSKVIGENLNNSDERFWQKLFEENQWIIGQIFATPCTLFKREGYVGGRNITGTGSNLCDFIYKNNISNNVSLVEIKNPCTPLIGKEYRHTFSLTIEFSGAINQLLNYRDSLLKEFYSLTYKLEEKFEAFSPKCILIIGRMSEMTEEQRDTFENFRNNFCGIQIVTFDELYEKVRNLKDIMIN